MSEERIGRQQLRELAQAAPHKDWRAGSYYGKPFLAEIEVLAETPDGLMVVMQGNQNFTAESVATVAFVGAASPAIVLALLDEIDRLEDAFHGASTEVHGLSAQHGRDSAELRRLCQARDDARKERDQLKAENAELRKAAASAFEAGRAASRRPTAVLQRSGNSWNVFEQRYNADRTERNDRFIRGGFVTSVDASSWARSNGYEVEV